MDTKTCTKCRRTLPIEYFHRQGSKRKAQCKDCLSIYYKKIYERPERQKQIRAAVRKRELELREFIKELKAQPCTDCGNSYPYYVMDFDHSVGEKTMVVSLMAHRGWSKERILEEVDKCELVCANCHRERTHRREHGAQ